MDIERIETEFDKMFPNDLNQFYEVSLAYANLTPEDTLTAFQLAQKAWVLAERWSSLEANATKLATLKTNKTDIKAFCYRKYKLMEKIFEHCKVIHRLGEEDLKRKRVGA